MIANINILKILTYILLTCSSSIYWLPFSKAADTNQQNILILEQKAKQGDVHSQYTLAEVYYHGNSNIPTDKNKAIKWYREAADQGNIDAQNRLKEIYNNKIDHIKIAKQNEKAANQGNVDAQYALGKTYEYGEPNIPIDINKAIKWYKQAASHGDIESLNCLGNIYFDQKNYKEAINWYKKAADHGNALSQNTLGNIYKNGLGINKNIVMAKTYYKQACISNLKWACESYSKLNFKK